MFQKLKEAFEGRTIIAVEPANAQEAICCFKLSDGKAWRLHATDLGYWLEETAGFEGYSSLTNLLTDYGHHVYWLLTKYDYELPDARIKILENDITVTAPDDKVYTIAKSKCSEAELKILNHPEGLKLMEKSAELGNSWKLDFISNREELPKELEGLIK